MIIVAYFVLGLLAKGRNTYILAFGRVVIMWNMKSAHKQHHKHTHAQWDYER